MNDWIPGTRELEDAWVLARMTTRMGGFWPPLDPNEARDQFQRALAEHDRQVKAEAWAEGFKQGGPMHDADMDDPDAHTRNPYLNGDNK